MGVLIPFSGPLRCAAPQAILLRKEAGHTDFAGQLWDAVLLSAGLSGTNVYFSPEVLKRAAPLFEGARVYLYEFNGKLYEHLPQDIKERHGRGVFGNLAGWIENARFGTSPIDGRPAVLGRIVVNKPDVAAELTRVWQGARHLMPGLSIDVQATYDKDPVPIKGAGIGRRVHEISRADSVDVVTSPAAGAGFTRLVASMEAEPPVEIRQAVVTLLERLGPRQLVGRDLSAVSETEAVRLLEDVVTEYRPATLEEQNFVRPLMLLKDLIKQGQAAQSLTLLERIIGGMAYDAATDPTAGRIERSAEAEVLALRAQVSTLKLATDLAALRQQARLLCAGTSEGARKGHATKGHKSDGGGDGGGASDEEVADQKRYLDELDAAGASAADKAAARALFKTINTPRTARKAPPAEKPTAAPPLAKRPAISKAAPTGAERKDADAFIEEMRDAGESPEEIARAERVFKKLGVRTSVELRAELSTLRLALEVAALRSALPGDHTNRPARSSVAA